MKRIISILLTGLMLFSTVAIAQAQQTTTTTTTATSTQPTTVSNPADPLAVLIASTPTSTMRGKLLTIQTNRDTITKLRATTTLRITALRTLIANMPEDDDNEALEKARDIVEGFEDRVKSGIEHDRQILRQIEVLSSHIAKFRQNTASQVQNNANGVSRRVRTRTGKQDDDDERKNDKNKQHMGQNRRSERDEDKILKRIDRIIKSQERIIQRLERRIERINDLIEELTP